MDKSGVDKRKFCFDLKIVKSKKGDPLIVVCFNESSNYWKRSNSWCPTLDELEYLYKTKKMMEAT